MGIPLVVSAISYESSYVEDYESDELFVVELIPKLYLLPETEIIAKRIKHRRRKSRLNQFKDEFLGKSSNANRCEILNETDLQFNYDKKSKVLYASSKKPLIILNQNLGYKITYYLEEFRSTRKYTFYQGSFFFEEITPKNSVEEKKFEDNRFSTYLGSRMSLIRAIYKNKLKQNLFTLTDTSDYEFFPDQFVIKHKGGLKSIRLGQELKIHYGYPQFRKVSKMTPLVSSITITKEGYFNAKTIRWSGYISFRRIADLLPFDYELNNKQRSIWKYQRK